MRRRQHTQRERDYLVAALKFARDFGFKGTRLPRGSRHSSDECPLSRALGPGWLIAGHLAVLPDDQLKIITLPGYVSGFIALFDLGRYPELVERTAGA